MQAAAPGVISLWYFDETKGIWKEEGAATKQNASYLGTVTHFSFWNAGEPGADVRLDATFKNDSSGCLVSVTLNGSIVNCSNTGTRIPTPSIDSFPFTCTYRVKRIQ